MLLKYFLVGCETLLYYNNNKFFGWAKRNVMNHMKQLGGTKWKEVISCSRCEPRLFNGHEKGWSWREK